MGKFCTKCGHKLDKNTGLCPNCDKSVIHKGKKNVKSEYKKSCENRSMNLAKHTMGKTNKKVPIKIIVGVLTFLLIVGGATGTLIYVDLIDIPAFGDVFDFYGISEHESKTESNNISDTVNSSNEEEIDEMEELDKKIEKALGELGNTSIDADSYFQNNSTVVSETGINDSNNVHTEMEAYNNLFERGFTEYPVETEYSMNGEYSGSTVISGTSSTKHPMYQTTYVTNSGDIWSIFEINGVVMANPVSYNSQTEDNVQVIISETEMVTSYDCATNKFYVTIPNISELIVKTVSRIDAETIENLTFGEIDKL